MRVWAILLLLAWCASMLTGCRNIKDPVEYGAQIKQCSNALSLACQPAR